MASLSTLKHTPSTPLGGGVEFARCRVASGFFFRAHRSDLSTSRNSSDCACRSLASCVKTRRQKVRTAARAQVSFEVLSMPALCAQPIDNT